MGGQTKDELAILHAIKVRELRSSYEVRYFATEAEIESAAQSAEPIWAAIVFSAIPGVDGQTGLTYDLRFNASALPQQRKAYDRFPNGLSEQVRDPHSPNDRSSSP